METGIAVPDNMTVLRRTETTAYTIAEMRERVGKLDDCYRGLMQDGTDYGVIGGTKKPTLLQPGAQLLCTFFGLAPAFEKMPNSVEDWEKGFFALTVKCILTRTDGVPVAEGIGACNSKEDKYRWRNQERSCPNCGQFTIRSSKAEYGGGYYCNKKSGGCGAKFQGDDADAIDSQPAGRIENPEPWTLHNTILKMSQKRALVAATLNGTGASRIFTQDIEDLPEFTRAAATEVYSPPADPTPNDSGNRQETAPAGTRDDEGWRDVPVDESPPKKQPPKKVLDESPATIKARMQFDEQWAKGTIRAVACGAIMPDPPDSDAPKSRLDAKLRHAAETITNREKLNATLAERVEQANGLGADFGVPDPEKLTDREVHEAIATADQAIAAVGMAPAGDDNDAPF